MRGIELIMSIRLMGFNDGVAFWFKWSFIDPIKVWWWLNISHKEYCTYSGWHCGELSNGKYKVCLYEHLTTKKQIKEIWKEHKEESKIIIGSDDGVCAYCGKEEGTITIDDPNWDTLKRWLVCESCDEVLKLQRESSMPFTKIERQHKISDRLLEISKETGQPIMSAVIDKSGVASVKFDGSSQNHGKGTK